MSGNNLIPNKMKPLVAKIRSRKKKKKKKKKKHVKYSQLKVEINDF